jgi:N-acetylmuramoyl-L-alanine amidase
LNESGVGHWVAPAPIEDAPFLGVGDCGSGVSELQMKLADYGYGISMTGNYDAATRDVIMAFQRHFRPERIDGVADASTVKTLADLIAARPVSAV